MGCGGSNSRWLTSVTSSHSVEIPGKFSVDLQNNQTSVFAVILHIFSFHSCKKARLRSVFPRYFLMYEFNIDSKTGELSWRHHKPEKMLLILYRPFEQWMVNGSCIIGMYLRSFWWGKSSALKKKI